MRFAHIADTHIRNLKYHFEYRSVFKKIYNSLRKQNVDYIVHCGDIAHTKTQISPEFVDMCRDFFVNLSSIAPTYIILGNHDGNLRNGSRQDALSPIIQAIDSPDLILLKGAGEEHISEEFCLNVLSVFDEENWTDPTDEGKVNIALYHGAINKSTTDSNWSLAGDHNINIFDKFDYAFLGDIHKTQQLDDAGRIRYAGSTIQQNFGESLEKGYLLWDIDNKEDFTVEHVTFTSPKPFITIPLTKAGNLPRKLTIPKTARLRVVSENNISLDKMRKAVDILKYKYAPESVSFLNRAASKKVAFDTGNTNKQHDLRDTATQEALLKEYLKEFEVTDDVMKKVVDLNKSYNGKLQDSAEALRNVSWSLDTLTWDYLFNYGEGNEIDFSKLEGIVGIFGKNYSGKSAIVDALLYTLFNSTSKKIIKNLNVINQNQDSCNATAKFTINGNQYVVERGSKKYTKRLHGVQTQEAKTDLEFYEMDALGQKTELNGLSRQDTDKNIRKYTGSLEDFLTTSMASQLDSLSFINEGSTKRKEILAKFLDIEVFEKKFKLAKEDSAITAASLRRLEGRDYEGEIKALKSEILKSELKIESNQATCLSLRADLEDLAIELKQTQDKIDSVPAEVIDPVVTASRIEKKKLSILKATRERKDAISELSTSEESFSKIVDFEEQFDVDSYRAKKEIIVSKRQQISNLILQLKESSKTKTENVRKQDLLAEVPCGTQFPSCRFIKDAHAAGDLIQISERNMSDISRSINTLGKEVGDLLPFEVEEYLDKYEKLIEKKNNLATSIAMSKLSIERADSLLFREQVEMEALQKRTEEYQENKEAIENLKELMKMSVELQEVIDEKRIKLESCEHQTMLLHKKHGSLEEKISTTRDLNKEYEALKEEYAAYHLLQTCYHPNGISYDIIKKRLPIINQEIAKVLTNIVDFEIFIENDDKRLDIFIKHPSHGPRPLEMGSGAEKAIASMAIRLAFLTVSSLPKSDLFILDEPGTALDEENMEGFVRILDMVKGYFKTVILISHLDSLKDCVDMQINIERNGSYAHVNI